MRLSKIFVLGAAVVLAASCQTNKLSSNEKIVWEELEGVAVAQPSRDPFSEFDNVPSSLDEVGPARSCYVEAVTPIEDFVEKMDDRFRPPDLEGRHLHNGRSLAESYFKRGLPVHAARMLEAIKGYSDPSWKSETMGTNAFLATFHAAYGNYEIASRRLSTAQSNYRRHKESSCRIRNFYWLERAKAYISLAEADPFQAIEHSKQARYWLNEKASDGECFRRGSEWRLGELSLIEGQAFFEIGNLARSEFSAREVLRVTRNTKGSSYRRALQLLGGIKARQQRYTDAIKFGLLAKAAQKNSCLPEFSLERAETNKDLALWFIAAGRVDEAERVINELEHILQDQPEIWENLFENSVDRGLIFLENEDRSTANSIFKNAQQILSERFGSGSYLAMEARMLAMLTEPQHEISTLGKALQELIQKWKSSLSREALEAVDIPIRLKWILEDYLRLIFANTSNSTEMREAYELFESLRSGTVQTALNQTALRRIAPDDLSRKLLRDYQDLRHKVHVLRQRLEDGLGYRYVGEDTINAIKITLADAEVLASKTEAKVRLKIPAYDEITGAKFFKLDDITSVMEVDERIVSTFVGREKSYVWTFGKDGIVKGHTVEKSAEEWITDIRALRRSVEPSGGYLRDLWAFDTEAAHRMYIDMLGPLESDIRGAGHLIFSTDSFFAEIPLTMMLTGPVESISRDGLMFETFAELPWLIQQYAVSYVPSVSALTLLRKSNPKSTEKRLAFLGVGDPVYDPSRKRSETRVATVDRGIIHLRNAGNTRSMASAQLRHLPPLPETADEVLAIGQTLGADLKQDVLIGANASEARVRQLNESAKLESYRVISFATHGLVPGDLDGLNSPALALSAPDQNKKGPWDDGLLTSEEIMEMNLGADWVALSACNTSSTGAQSEEAYSGLGLAFFYAGAKSLLLSHWPVMSISTKDLMIKVFEESRKNTLSRAQSLRLAILDLMKNGSFKGNQSEFSYAHPLFWAPFSLVGDGGGSNQLAN